ncbi:MAG: ABC transporter transmembrane domain-containing protein, partial [Betaproteobacteria bacterium]
MNASISLLKLYGQLQGMHLDDAQLAHEFVEHKPDGSASLMGVAEVVQALHTLGFAASIQRGKRAALAKATLPALMPAADGHLMLVGKIDTGADAVVLQMAGDSEPRQVSLSAFDRLFCGVWIDASKTSAVHADLDGEAKAGERFGVGWFWHSLRKYKTLLGEILLASLFVQVIALLTPLIFQVVIDKVLTHRSMTTLEVMVAALLGASIFEVALGAMRHYLMSHTTNRIDVELGAKLFRHLLHLPLSYFESRRSGDTVARVRELENARNFMTGQALTSWLDLLFAFVYLAIMFYYSVTLTLVVILALPVFFGASAAITPLLRKKLEDKFALGAENQAYLVETVTSMEPLKSHAVEPQWQREWERRLANYVNASFEGGHLANATNQFISLASKILTVILLWLGARLVIEGELSVGGLIAFNMLSGRVNAPVLKLASLWQDFTQMKVSIRRLGDIMDAPPEPAFSPGRSTPPDIQGQLRFEHMSFRYAPNAPEVLSDLSFEVQAGEVVGVVGVSGAGKTTLVKIIARLREA